MAQAKVDSSIPSESQYKHSSADSRNDSNQEYDIYSKSVLFRAVNQIEKSYESLCVLSQPSLSITQKILKSIGIDIMEFHKDATSINQVLPSSASIKAMHANPGLWKRLHSKEINLLTSTDTYDRINDTATTLSRLVSKLGKVNRKFYLEEHIARLITNTSSLHAQAHNKHLTNQVKLLSSLNSLLIVDEALSENRHHNFYHNHLKSIPTDLSATTSRTTSVYKSNDHRSALLTFIKHLWKMCNFDKTTYSITAVFFDSFVHNTKKSYPHVFENDPLVRSNPNVDVTTLIYNKYAIACLMIAGGLREHWVDMRRDSYLENIIMKNRQRQVFSIRDITNCQIEVIKVLPKSFTTIFTSFEYCLFFISMLRDFEESKSKSNSKVDSDGLGLGHLYSYLLKTCSICWIYTVIGKWDDVYICEGFNQSVPPSRAGAIIFLHIFLDFYQYEYDKNILWCRRFCNAVFKMLYDCDVGLWYHSIKNQIVYFYTEIAKNSDSNWKMYSIFKVASAQWSSHLKMIAAYKTKTLIEYMETGQKLCELDCVDIANIIPRLIQLVIPDKSSELKTFRAKQSIEHTNRVDSDVEEDTVKKRRS